MMMYISYPNMLDFHHVGKHSHVGNHSSISWMILFVHLVNDYKSKSRGIY